MLEVKNLNAYYGKSHILQGLNISVNEGEIVSLLGRNGVGRSTVLKSLMGMVQTQGSIIFDENAAQNSAKMRAGARASRARQRGFFKAFV